MHRLLVQLAGTNGSGKSTPLKYMYEASTDKMYVNDYHDRGINATHLNDMQVTLIGRYHTDCGGGDSVTGNGGLARINDTLDSLLSIEHCCGYPILFEGLLLASYVNMCKIAEIANRRAAKYIVIHCDPPNEVCVSRVYSRNGGKKINESNVIGRHDSLQRVIPKFAAEGLATVVRWNNSDVDYDEMFPALIDIIEMARYAQNSYIDLENT